MAEQDFLVGQLLIAMPNMGDPRFEKSVVLICAHDKDHAMGVVVNKPLTNLELGELLEQLNIDPRPGVESAPVHFGGPVKPSRGVVLHTLDYRLEATLDVTSDIGLTVTPEILGDIAGRVPNKPGPEKSLLAIGHAGWGPGQLESELRQNAWAFCDPSTDLVFADDPDLIWQKAFSTLGVTEAMFSGEWSASNPDEQLLN